MNAHTTKYAFGEYDEVTIGAVAYRPVSCSEAGYVFVREDRTGVAEQFSHDHLFRLVQHGKVRHVKGRFLPAEARRALDRAGGLLSARPGADTDQISLRISFVDSFLALEKEGRVNRSHNPMEAAMDAISAHAKELRADRDRSTRKTYTGRKIEDVASPSPCTLHRWVKTFESKGLPGLLGNRHNSGNRVPRIGSNEIALMMSVVQGFASPQCPIQQMIIEDVGRAFADANRKRTEAGQLLLTCPSRETIRKAIKELEPFQTDIHPHPSAEAGRDERVEDRPDDASCLVRSAADAQAGGPDLAGT